MIIMSKSDANQIWENELKVIRLLTENARMSNSEIAKKIGLTRQTVSKIIKNLEKNDLIWGYSLIGNPTKIGLNLYVLLLKGKPNLESDIFINRIMDFVKIEDRFTIYTGIFHGAYDWIAIFTAINIKEARKFVNKLKRGLEQFIDEIILMEQLVPVSMLQFSNPNLKSELNEALL